VEALVKWNSVIMVAALLPVTIFVILGIPHISPAEWVRTEGDVNAPLLISWVLWLYSGFASLGVITGQLKHPRKTLLQGIAILMPMCIVLNTVPLAISLGLDDDRGHYAAGHFNDVAHQLGGEALQFSFVAAANLTMLGLYSAQIITAEHTLMFLTELNISWGDVKPEHNGIWQYCAGKTSSGVRRLYILSNAALVLLLIATIPYRLLVQCEMLMYASVTLLLLYSFVRLHIVSAPDNSGCEGEDHAVFVIPGGTPAAIIAVLLPSLIILCYVSINVGNAICAIRNCITGSPGDVCTQYLRFEALDDSAADASCIINNAFSLCFIAIVFLLAVIIYSLLIYHKSYQKCDMTFQNPLLMNDSDANSRGQGKFDGLLSEAHTDEYQNDAT